MKRQFTLHILDSAIDEVMEVMGWSRARTEQELTDMIWNRMAESIAGDWLGYNKEFDYFDLHCGDESDENDPRMHWIGEKGSSVWSFARLLKTRRKRK